MVACQKDEFILKQEFINPYVELLIAQENFKEEPKKFLQAKNGILADYKIKYEEMKTHINEIKKRPEFWVQFQTEVSGQLKKYKIQYKGE